MSLNCTFNSYNYPEGRNEPVLILVLTIDINSFGQLLIVYLNVIITLQLPKEKNK